MNVHTIADNLPCNLIDIANQCKSSAEFSAVNEHFNLLSSGGDIKVLPDDFRFSGILALMSTRKFQNSNPSLSISRQLDKDTEEAVDTWRENLTEYFMRMKRLGFTHTQLFGNLSAVDFKYWLKKQQTRSMP
jgi:hypothetical protein